MEKIEEFSEKLSKIAGLSLAAEVISVPAMGLLASIPMEDLVIPILYIMIICFFATPVIALILSIVAIVLNHKNRMAIISALISVIIIILIVGFMQMAYYGMQMIAEMVPKPMNFSG